MYGKYPSSVMLFYIIGKESSLIQTYFLPIFQLNASMMAEAFS